MRKFYPVVLGSPCDWVPSDCEITVGNMFELGALESRPAEFVFGAVVCATRLDFALPLFPPELPIL